MDGRLWPLLPLLPQTIQGYHFGGQRRQGTTRNHQNRRSEPNWSRHILSILGPDGSSVASLEAETYSILPVDLEIVSACAGLPWPHRGWAAEVPKACHRVGLSHQVIFRNGSPEKAKYQQLMIQIKEHMEQPWNGAMIWPKQGNGEYDEWGKPSNRAVDFAMTWHAKGLNGDGLVRDYKLTRFLWANLWLIILALLRIIFGVQSVETVIEVAKRADTSGPVHCPVEVGKQWNSAGKKTTIREIYWTECWFTAFLWWRSLLSFYEVCHFLKLPTTTSFYT